MSLIFEKSLEFRESSFEKSAAISLMSTDVDEIAFCLEELNECWSRAIELAIGIALLSLQIGWVSVVPLFVVASRCFLRLDSILTCLVSSVGSSIITRHIGDRQIKWSKATQQRIGKTSAVLNEIKSVKLMGLGERVSELLQEERVKETKCMEKKNWLMVWVNVVGKDSGFSNHASLSALGNTPFVFAPAATFSLYALQIYITGSNSLDTNKAFTSLALISLVAYPASRLLSAIPNTAASLGCFDRIHEFLTNPAFIGEPDACQNGDPDAENYSDASPSNEAYIIEIQHAAISVPQRDSPILEDVSFALEYGMVVGVTGPVGSGKSSLLKLILGEILSTKGEVQVKPRTIGYCSQTPWITHGTIKDVITGYTTAYDALWYELVLEACALKTDLALLPAGEETIIGSRGIKLSGGQKQRIALARALYARPQLFILDDIFSSLDPKTQSAIWARLFGDGGLFKRLGATVLIVTNSSEPSWRPNRHKLSTNDSRNTSLGCG